MSPKRSKNRQGLAAVSLRPPCTALRLESWEAAIPSKMFVSNARTWRDYREVLILTQVFTRMLGKLEQLITDPIQPASRFQLLSAVTALEFGNKSRVLGTFNCELRIILWFRFHQQCMNNKAGTWLYLT